MHFSRRKAMAVCLSGVPTATAGLFLLVASAVSSRAAGQAPLHVSMLIPGRIDDGGFMEAGHRGLLAIEKELGATVAYKDKVEPKPELLAAALRELAQNKPDLVIAHGGQNAEAAKQVAQEFPGVQFAVVQGGVTGANLSSYEVLQEQSAWLAGAAGLMTRTNTVGHISGIKVTPGLKGRGAFHDGLMATNPDAKFLTIFNGSQDDAILSKATATALIESGADIVFTMLNAARSGVIEANRETGTRQIGNVRDWTADHPHVFVASAVADVSKAALRAAQDLADGAWKPGTIVRIGLEHPEAVRLALAPSVPAEIRAKLDELAQKIAQGEIEIATSYDGPEFTLLK